MESKTCSSCGETRPFYKGKYVCKVCWDARTKAYLATEEGRRSRRNTLLKLRYGVTIDQYDEMFKQQGGKCAICRTDKNQGRWEIFNVDHCHDTGRVRGLLCHVCNNKVEWFINHRDAVLAYIAPDQN